MRNLIKIITIILCSLLIILLYTSDLLFIQDSPAAKQGKLNLSSWDFYEGGIVKLNGEWECYDGQLLTPEDFLGKTENKPKLTGYTKLTASRLENLNGLKLSPEGVRTFRLNVEISPSQEPFGLKIENIRMSNRLYINGTVEGACGNPAEEDKGYVPKNAAYNAYFNVDGKDLEIVLQKANFDYPFSSDSLYSILLGSQENIELQKTMVTSIELSGAALSFFFGVYYLYLCYTEGRDKGALYSALQFFSLAVLLLFTGQKLIYGFFPGIPFELFCKLQLSSLIGVPLSTVAYTNYREKWVISDRLARLIFFVFCLYFFIMLLVDYRYSSYLNGIIYIFICFIYLYMIVKLWMAYDKVRTDKTLRKEILLYLSCTACLFVAFFNNFLYNLTWCSNRIFGSIGLCGFILLSQIILAFRYVVSYENMVKMDKIKDEFMVKTSYALKAPLNSILDISDHIIKDQPADVYNKENYMKNATYTKNMVQRLLNIVNTSLDLTLLDNDQLKLKLSPVDMKVCAELVIDSMKELVENRKITIISELDDSLFVEADETRIRQILWNLILNSLQNMERGIIWIRGKQEKGKAGIFVEDNGAGIPEEKWEEIFQPYMTLNAQGIGLGLYVSSRLVELMNGKIYVEWSKPGEGSRFVLLLPEAAVKDDKIDAGQKKERKLPGKFHSLTNKSMDDETDQEQDSKNTVLVVDDEIFNIQTARHVLGGEGYRILTAFSSEEALRMVTNQKVDLIILDAMMSGVSGISICKKIRETYSLIELPILISMVGMDQYDLTLGLEAGANDFIIKPFRESEIKARVKTLIELKKSIEETMKSELAFLQAQIKPHFVYNAINTIISFCYTDSEKAAKLLIDFSKYLRLTFDVDHKLMLAPLHRELELIEAYVAIEQARFGEKIHVQYDIDSELLHIKIPPLCIQPLVENAIKHGLYRKPEGGTVWISVKKEDADVKIEVRDNGLGISAEKLHTLRNLDQVKGGIGFSNISKRMGKWKQSQIEIESEQEKGTRVILRIKQDQGWKE
ncbi:ATP-binding protein [Clostridium aminobutyricum]|uniref:Stage 0 sporulation protein A homolog n=1 Tax=Clostridium aminobutyricum TaxID=33953 RepID=A0A939DA77_CLOAM|nr:ATP-binding protein [Clostridium aminobutyricum]MBN7773902.1 histidine kinase [Clostridium aminobutyricum]